MTSYSELKKNSALEGENLAYIENLYEQYLQNKANVDPKWQAYFASEFKNENNVPSYSAIRQKFAELARVKVSVGVGNQKSSNALQEKVSEWIAAYRRYGHLCAKTDPLNLNNTSNLGILNLATYGLSATDTNLYDAAGVSGLTSATLSQIQQRCEKIYCGPIGFETEYLDNPEEVQWLRTRVEQYPQWHLNHEEKIQLLTELSAVEGLEKTFGSRYVGVTRFSLEGGDSQIPFINYLIKNCTAFGTKEVVLGMAHRGRLNVLVNVLGMPPKTLFDQFDGKFTYPQNCSYDVKYHLGYSADLSTPNGPLHASLCFNPSHLEIISPVAQGSVRARQDRRHDFAHHTVFPIQIHGDSAFIGQGVVMETFGLSQTRGFKVGGSIHLVINNQVGFTTSHPEDTRSSRYCTDVAKIVNAPVFHVNGDQPEAVLFIAKLALDYHHRFQKDVVIDLVCYRRYGHNEGDEPSATQPLMYQVVRKLPTTRKLYADQLIKEGIITQEQVDSLINNYRQALEENKTLITHVDNPDYARYQMDWARYASTSWTDSVATALSQQTFSAIESQITTTPENFKVQAQVAKILANRANAYAGKTPLIWGDAEMLAYASLVYEGYGVRLTGQDAGRGTFAHRHAVIYDQSTGEAFASLQHLGSQQADFTVIDSLLSENAVMAFEYGYAATNPQTLTIWEAQYGDFANGAQVVADQFLSAGEQKWQRLCGLVLLLPHGYEGAGPEHSSSRVERYLQMCAQDNMQVCVPTTAAQIFHLLRRQMIRPYRKPLIVLTPKGILRKATSTMADIFEGAFQCVISDQEIAPTAVKRVMLCSGKVYYELCEKREAMQNKDTAILRLEQLYPFPKEQLQEVLGKFSNAKSFLWCQEEPENQGAWRHIRDNLNTCLSAKQQWEYLGREASASTAAGYHKLHEQERQAFLARAFAAK